MIKKKTFLPILMGLIMVFALFTLIMYNRATKWHRVETEHFTIKYHSQKSRIDSLSEILEELYQELKPTFYISEEQSKQIPISITVEVNDLEHQTKSSTASYNNSILQVNLNSLLENGGEHTLRHELVHVLTNSNVKNEKQNIPTWFGEGAATYYQYDKDGKFFDKAIIKEAVRTGNIV